MKPEPRSCSRQPSADIPPEPALPDRVVLLNDASVARGGATALALAQARLLAQRGVPVTLLTGEATPAHAGDSGSGVERVHLGSRRLRDTNPTRAAVQGIWHRRAQREVVRLRERLDSPRTVWHVHNWSNILSPAALAALEPVAHRTVLHAHDYFLACPNGAYHDYARDEGCDRVPLSGACLVTACDQRSRAEKTWRVTRQAVLRRAFGADARARARVLLIHESMRAGLHRAGWPEASLEVLPNPARPFVDRPIRAEANARVLFVGRIELEKGLAELLAAARRARVTVDVAGDGVQLGRLRERHPEARFHGWLDRAGLAALARRARCLVVPSLVTEPYGLVVVEALGCGLPVVISDRALLADQVLAAGAGIGIDPSDPHAFVRALETVRDAPDAAIRRMGEAAVECAGRIAPTERQWTERLLALYARRLDTTSANARRP